MNNNTNFDNGRPLFDNEFNNNFNQNQNNNMNNQGPYVNSNPMGMGIQNNYNFGPQYMPQGNNVYSNGYQPSFEQTDIPPELGTIKNLNEATVAQAPTMDVLGPMNIMNENPMVNNTQDPLENYERNGYFNPNSNLTNNYSAQIPMMQYQNNGMDQMNNYNNLNQPNQFGLNNNQVPNTPFNGYNNFNNQSGFSEYNNYNQINNGFDNYSMLNGANSQNFDQTEVSNTPNLLFNSYNPESVINPNFENNNLPPINSDLNITNQDFNVESNINTLEASAKVNDDYNDESSEEDSTTEAKLNNTQENIEEKEAENKEYNILNDKKLDENDVESSEEEETKDIEVKEENQEDKQELDNSYNEPDSLEIMDIDSDLDLNGEQTKEEKSQELSTDKAPILDQVEKIKTLVEEIKKSGIEIELEEFDFESMYQLIIKINK